MSQQSQDGRSRILSYLPFVVMLMVWYFVLPKMLTPQPPSGTVAQQAQAAEAAGRNPDPNVAKADKVKKLEEAANKYEELYQSAKDKPEGWEARYKEINVYDYLAQLEGRSSTTKWYDASEQKLKEMEGALLHKTGTVPVERNGVVTQETGDLGKIATQRLDEIRAARDKVNAKQVWYIILDRLVKLCGNNPSYSYFLALLVMVLVLKTLSFPLQKKQYQSSQDMMRIQPLIKAEQERLKDRPQEEVNKRIFEIYKENNVNMVGGCLPAIAMMFVLWPMFFMVRAYEYQFTHATFLWIGSPASQQYWWMAKNLAQFDVPLFVTYLLSMVGSSLLMPAPADPQQAQTQKMMAFSMPLIFGFMMWSGKWSSAFMLYWLILNVVSIYQSWVLNKKYKTGGTGGTPATVTETPAAPLEPMKGTKAPTPKKGSRGRGPAGRPSQLPQNPRNSSRKPPRLGEQSAE